VLEGETDGFHLFKKIKGDPELARIPIIMESGKPGMKDMFKNMGAAEFFVKPYSMENLIGKVEQSLSE
jgi:PleD family two-component response regulator